MDGKIKQRVAVALKCKPEEVPDEPLALKRALENRRVVLKQAKAGKHG